ncbi:hypothetical protein [Streptomyces sp. NPDC051577]|uniref:hypothetical protein n=1 Tax=Streptomyces sp. NPDC051577 TaxID=3155166 RepID=UPI003445B123
MTLLTVAQATEVDNLFHARMDEQLAPGYVRSGEGAALIDLIRLPRPDIRAGHLLGIGPRADS